MMLKLDAILSNGIKNPFNKGDLTNYFVREFKKAERDNFYTLENFFPPFYQRIEAHRRELKKILAKEKDKLEMQLQKAKKNELSFQDYYYLNFLDKKGINYQEFKSQQNEIAVKEIEKQINNLRIENIETRIFRFKITDLTITEKSLKEAEEILSPQVVKEQKQKTPLEDFFIDEVSPKLITAIQEKFNHLRGKEMAILIFLLHKKYSLIYLDNNNRKANSRIHFFRALTSTNLKRTGINNFFEPITANTTVNEKDEVFVKIDNQLKEMVSNG